MDTISASDCVVTCADLSICAFQDSGQLFPQQHAFAEAYSVKIVVAILVSNTNQSFPQQHAIAEAHSAKIAVAWTSKERFS